MSNQNLNEKEAEKHEKEDEKRNEKSPEEKSWDEKWSRDPLSAVVWAAIFIWAGVVFLFDNLGAFDRWLAIFPGFTWVRNLEAWSIILIGAGIIFLIEVAVRLSTPIYRKPIGGSIFLGVVLIGIGLGEIFGWDIVWPLILIALGVSVLLRGFTRRRSG